MKTILAALATAALAAAAPAAPLPPPKLLVVISVDQFSANLFNEYRQRFTEGMKRLESQGVVFPTGYQSHAATETCPGHSTLLTGDHPGRTGLIANNWIDRSVTRGADGSHLVYCAEDEHQPNTTSAPKDYVVSTIHLKVPTLGDRMKQANPAAQVVSVAGKDRAAVMMGGHHTDQIWFIDPKTSHGFVTLSDHTAAPPAAVAKASAEVADAFAQPAPRTAPAACAERDVATPIPGMFAIGTVAGDPAPKPGDMTDFRTSPAFDKIVADLAIGLIDELKLGHGAATDLIAIGLSATDYVGHAYGTEGQEMCVQLMGMDHQVGRILAALDATHVPYAVVLTADHGGHDVAERDQADAYPKSVRVAPGFTFERFGRALDDRFKLGLDPKKVVLGDGLVGDWYLSNDVPEKLRPRVLAALAEMVRADPQVAAVETTSELRQMPMPVPPVENWSLAERARASFDPARSGDLVVFLKPYITPLAIPKPGITATHGSPWDYDRRVPILFYRPGERAFEQPLPVETVDIMPTLAAMIGLPIAKGDVDGRCLGISGVSCPN